MASPSMQCLAAVQADPITAQVELDEGEVLVVYDDATGQPIVPGSHVIGNPTIASGVLLCKPGGLTHAESLALTANRIAIARRQAAGIPVFSKLNDARQGVLVEMVFQLGLNGVLGFKNTLAAMERGDFAAAAEGIRNSHLAQQTPARAQRYAQIIETGEA
jgi:lysozyme